MTPVLTTIGAWVLCGGLVLATVLCRWHLRCRAGGPECPGCPRCDDYSRFYHG